MRPVLHVTAGTPVAAGADEGVRFAESLVEAIVGEFSRPGDRVLDPFAGFGTTLVVSERMGRKATGVELLPDRVALVRDRLSGSAEVIQADARHLDELGLGSFELCFTSPPYMPASGHPENPLTGYRTRDGHYGTYLRELGRVFAATGRHLSEDGRLVVNAANLRTANGVTTLAWDLAEEIGRHLRFVGEIYLDWDELPDQFTGDYCLVFHP